jgi:hypothetical protein
MESVAIIEESVYLVCSYSLSLSLSRVVIISGGGALELETMSSCFEY